MESSRALRYASPAIVFAVLLGGCTTDRSEPRWLAGDHHIHSVFSVGYDRTRNPPTITIGGDAVYPMPKNAEMARQFGLAWTVATDHGGPNHARINQDLAYTELLRARVAQPTLIQYFGMELNTPGADHSSLIIPKTSDEAARLKQLESAFDVREVWPVDPARNQPLRMLEALRVMDEFPKRPIVIANHPSRSAKAPGEYGRTKPSALRDWNDTAPGVAVGMAGAPGRQAATLSPNPAPRGRYRTYRTRGGFDPMTAILGGFWDSMLGEGRHWFITANSDSHLHYTEGGTDFWPGEFSKTYVYAIKDYDAILESLRAGKVFVTTGDLVSEVFLSASAGNKRAEIGETLELGSPGPVLLNIRVRDPDTGNNNGENPVVNRIDLVIGDITGPTTDRSRDTNETTRVLQRFDRLEWKQDGEYLTMQRTINVTGPVYLRLRGTNTDQLEPEIDYEGENPWEDLWFYTNPVFVDVISTEGP